MRMLGSSGIWEIFIPDVVEGAAYKYEILTEGDHLRLKAGPSCLPHGRHAAHRLDRASLAPCLE
jgi:1,4-alpha-glucan branching enzyme